MYINMYVQTINVLGEICPKANAHKHPHRHQLDYTLLTLERATVTVYPSSNMLTTWFTESYTNQHVLGQVLQCFKIPFTRLHPYCAVVKVLCMFLSLTSVHMAQATWKWKRVTYWWSLLCCQRSHLWTMYSTHVQLCGRNNHFILGSLTPLYPTEVGTRWYAVHTHLRKPHQCKMDISQVVAQTHNSALSMSLAYVPWVSHPSGWSSLWGLGTHRCGQSSVQAPQVQPCGRCTSLSSPSLHTSQGCPLPIWSPTPLCVLKPGAQSDQPALPSWPTKI